MLGMHHLDWKGQEKTTQNEINMMKKCNNEDRKMSQVKVNTQALCFEKKKRSEASRLGMSERILATHT